MLLNRTGGGGENVTPQVETYESLLEIAITELQGKAFKPTQTKTINPVPEGMEVVPDDGYTLAKVILNSYKLEGQYVWKKYGEVTKTVTVDFTNSPTNVLNVSSDDFEPRFIDASFFVGFTGTYGSGGVYEFRSETEIVFGGSTVYTYTYDPATAKITLSGPISNSSVAFSSVTGERAVFVPTDYVVSDDENAYHDGGFQDGYGYTKVVEGIPVDECITPELFGCTDMAEDYFTVSSNVSSSTTGLQASHSLNKAPKVVILQALDEPVNNVVSWQLMNYFAFNITEISQTLTCGKLKRISSGSPSYGQSSVKTSSTNYVAPTTSKVKLYSEFLAGVRYKMITIG